MALRAEHPPAEHALAALAPALLAAVPRVVAEARGVLWADARGLAAHPTVEALLAIARRLGHTNLHVGIARTPIAAEVAARHVSDGRDTSVILVPPDADRCFLAPHPIAALGPSARLAALVGGIGIETCRDLAALDQEAVEVRLGAEGVALWRLARADDPRPIFSPAPHPFPSASLEWTDYALREPERLLFVINSLTAAVCAELSAWGEGARVMTLAFTLAGRGTVEHRVHATRATASRKTWMRRIRAELERLRLPDAVAGVALRAEGVSGTEARQGDLFDRGFATAAATEAAVAEFLDERGAIIVRPTTTAHPLLDRRVTWRAQEPAEVVDREARSSDAEGTPPPPQLTVQLLPEPHRVAVTTVRRRGHEVPVRYRERRGAGGSGGREGGEVRDVEVLAAAGPDCISGGEADAPYAREYFHCVTADGRLVLLFRDARAGAWYVHGWWD